MPALSPALSPEKYFAENGSTMEAPTPKKLNPDDVYPIGWLVKGK